MIKLTEEAGFEPARLDRDYNAKATVSPEAFAAEMVRYREASIAPRADWGRHFDVVYDEESGQRIDIFGPPSQSGPCPVFVFVHGGYWRALSKEDSAMMAGMLAAEGIATVVVDYRLAPEVSLAEITREVRAALAFVWRHGREYGLDPDRISVGGVRQVVILLVRLLRKAGRTISVCRRMLLSLPCRSAGFSSLHHWRQPFRRNG